MNILAAARHCRHHSVATTSSRRAKVTKTSLAHNFFQKHICSRELITKRHYGQANSNKGEEFNPMKPFNKQQTNLLNPKVQSDHAEIGLAWQQGFLSVNKLFSKAGVTSIPFVLNSWNISNPIYHKYFAMGKMPPFKDSHLYVKEPLKEGKLDPLLLAKINHQISVIVNRLVQDKVHIQVIVEGSEFFFNKLDAELQRKGAKNQFGIISLLDTKLSANWDSHKNVTGIIVNKDCFTIMEGGIRTLKYNEVADANNAKEYLLPYTHLKDKAHNQYMIAGVHLPGCNSQFPQSGLETLAEHINNLFVQTAEKADVIALGDFNTTPANAREALLKKVKYPSCLMQPEYLTHVNPNSEAAKYDFAIVVGSKETVQRYHAQPIAAMSEASQALVSSIESSLI